MLPRPAGAASISYCYTITSVAPPRGASTSHVACAPYRTSQRPAFASYAGGARNPQDGHAHCARHCANDRSALSSGRCRNADCIGPCPPPAVTRLDAQPGRCRGRADRGLRPGRAPRTSGGAAAAHPQAARCVEGRRFARLGQLAQPPYHDQYGRANGRRVHGPGRVPGRANRARGGQQAHPTARRLVHGGAASGVRAEPRGSARNPAVAAAR